MPCKSGCLLTYETIVMLICPELFLISVLMTHVEVEGDFLDRFLCSKRSTYTRVNTVIQKVTPKVKEFDN